MGDLISRKRLLEHISAWQQANAGAETQTEYAVIESCYRMVKNFPAEYKPLEIVTDNGTEYICTWVKPSMVKMENSAITRIILREKCCPSDFGLPTPLHCNHTTCDECWTEALRGGEQE